MLAQSRPATHIDQYVSRVETASASATLMLVPVSSNFNVLGTSAVYWNADTVAVNLSVNSDSILIRIVDGSACISDSTIFIPQPDSIVASISSNTFPLCSYDSTWIYLDSISGGTGPYVYEWTDGSTSDSIYVAAGFNKVFVTDANGCLDSTNGIYVITIM